MAMHMYKERKSRYEKIERWYVWKIDKLCKNTDRQIDELIARWIDI